VRLQPDGTLSLSPSDLSGHLACPHLTTLDLAAARGEIVKPRLDSPHRDLIFRKGNEHEAAYLAGLEAKGRSIVRIPTYDDDGFDAAEARRLTEEAIRAAEADVVYQPYLADGSWRGFADFLELLPGGTYEPVDTKLARSAKPAHVLQLMFYAEQVERIQGTPVEQVHVENGRGRRETFRVAEFQAYYRRVRGRFLAALAHEPETYGWLCDHCGICDFRRLCREQRVADDHLTLVAGVRRSQAETLLTHGIATLEALGDLEPGAAVDGLRPEALEAIRHQASLQLRGRREGRYVCELLPDEEERGFRLLPEPDPGDVWFDMEGHPFYETARGLEYLFGFCYRDDGEVVYRAIWGRDRDDERAAFEAFVDWVVARRRRHPGMHVYHYAAYERSALRRLMGEHGTREQEVDDFLRQEVLVDLYRVVKQALRASVESYSIKEIEKLYGFVRTAEVAGGDESVVRFEEWVESGDDTLLEDVERYNEEDCRSTYELHEWLLAIRPDGVPWRPPPDDREPSDEAAAAADEREELKASLLEGAVEGDPGWLLAQLLDYHRREAKPQWWEWFHHRTLDEDELIADGDTIGGLQLESAPEQEKSSLVYRLAFPEQEHKIGARCVDPDTEKVYTVEVDDEIGIVTLRRAKSRAGEPLPRALIPGPPITDREQRRAVARFARAYLERGAPAAPARYPALVDLLERRPPEASLGLDDPVDVVLTLGRSTLFVQGPPGSGKTWHGARMAVALMRAGHRVGVTSLSHKAIHNFLHAVEAEARTQGFGFKGMKKSTEGDPETRFSSDGSIESSDSWRALLADDLHLLAGTAWLFSREDFDGRVHTMFVDEAGQVSLADAIAVGTAAERLVLLGDPNQLAQVSQGAQPEQARRSSVGHLLGDAATVSPEHGLFLARTWRLRPEICRFTSQAYYDGRLAWAPVCETRSIALGDGPAVLPVEHEGCGQMSWQEADAVAGEIRRLLGTPFTDRDGARSLAASDVLVVAPYNAQVRALRARVPDGVRVGTVDKFQGQQAPVVIVSMASSSAEDAPRGIDFAFERHRVNVATSRAQCRVVLVCAPRLLDADCRTVEQMRLVGAVCRFVELATAR
jgi:predicted RecB family nuclease